MHNKECDFGTPTGKGTIKEESVSMLLKLGWYKFKLECYNLRVLNVIPMEIANHYDMYTKWNKKGI